MSDVLFLALVLIESLAANADEAERILPSLPRLGSSERPQNPPQRLFRQLDPHQNQVIMTKQPNLLLNNPPQPWILIHPPLRPLPRRLLLFQARQATHRDPMHPKVANPF
jgi:hypothetical protein